MYVPLFQNSGYFLDNWTTSYPVNISKSVGAPKSIDNNDKRLREDPMLVSVVLLVTKIPIFTFTFNDYRISGRQRESMWCVLAIMTLG